MRRYRRAPVLLTKSIRADDGWVDDNQMDRNITVYEAESHWPALPILDADGRPIEVYVGPDPIGFAHFEEE